jgi:hypothetical protein
VPVIVLLALLAGQGRADAGWSGFYAGARAGAGSVGALTGREPLVSYGIQLGYRRDLGAYVIGAELGYEQLDPASRAAFDDHASHLTFSLGRDMGRVLPYVLIGKGSLTFRGPGPRSSDDGAYAGAGVAYAITPHLIGSAEALHGFYRDFDHFGVDRSFDTLVLGMAYRF